MKNRAEDEIMELFWQDGEVIAQPQNQRKSPQITAPPLAPPQPPQPQQQQQLYMAEDEMATWLHYPLEDLYSELLCENPTSPLPPPELRPSRPSPPLQTPATTSNFQLFSRMRGGNNLERSSSLRPGSTVVESNTTPALATMRSVGEVSSALPITHGGERLQKGGSSGEVTVSSSSGYSGGPANTRTVNTEEGGGEGVIDEAEKRKKKRKESTPPPSTTAGQVSRFYFIPFFP